MEQSQRHSLALALGEYAPAPNAIKENWRKDYEKNADCWEKWLEEYERDGISALPGIQVVWTEGEVVKSVKYALQNLPRERLTDNGKFDRGSQRAEFVAMYAGRVKDEMGERLVEISSVLNTVSDILTDTLTGRAPMSQACRDRGIDYIRFRRFCEKLLQVRDGGKSQMAEIPKYEPTYYEKFYAKVFGVSDEEASIMMPEDAEETAEFILTTLSERERDILKRHVSGETTTSIGESYGVTRERARQILAKTIRKLHSPPRLRILQDGKVASDVKDLEAKLEKERLAEEKARTAEKLRELEARMDQSYSEMWIEELDPSVRTYNCLRKENINTVGDLLRQTRYSLGKIRGMGKASLEEIDRLLASRGLHLKGEQSDQ